MKREGRVAISRPRAVLICLVLLCLAVAVLTSTDLGESWIGRFDLECELWKAQFYVGEPVVVRLRWRNGSIVPMAVVVWQWFRDPLGYYQGFNPTDDFDLSVMRDGKAVARKQAHSPCFGPAARTLFQPLPPSYQLERVVRLEWHFDVAEPGEYLLRVSYKPRYPEGKLFLKERLLARRFRTVLETPFEVIPWRQDPLSDARELAAAGDPGGFHLLGLHGGVEVVPLLVSESAHEDKEVRYEVARALARIGGSEAIRGLGEL
ncbi:MAG: HEAT repeat domain-containing protein, partial [bacterium]|nr:HEAT repeat domain-containing protein [bacterium]